MDGAGGGGLPPQHRGPTGVARLLHEAGIPSTDGASRARGVARQHRSSVYREPVTPEVQCLLPRRPPIQSGERESHSNVRLVPGNPPARGRPPDPSLPAARARRQAAVGRYTVGSGADVQELAPLAGHSQWQPRNRPNSGRFEGTALRSTLRRQNPPTQVRVGGFSVLVSSGSAGTRFPDHALSTPEPSR